MYTFKVGDPVEIFEDTFTQRKHEGIAKIINIYKQDKGVADCDVQFYVDIYGDNPRKMEHETVRRYIKVPNCKRK